MPRSARNPERVESSQTKNTFMRKIAQILFKIVDDNAVRTLEYRQNKKGEAMASP